jgi:putative FmdB family regulatory protein
MPLYEYHCDHCQTDFDDLVRMGTPDQEIECPSCGRHEARRLLSVFSGRSRGAAGASTSSDPSSCGSSGFT